MSKGSPLLFLAVGLALGILGALLFTRPNEHGSTFRESGYKTAEISENLHRLQQSLTELKDNQQPLRTETAEGMDALSRSIQALARSGDVFYLSGWPDDELLASVLRRLFQAAQLSTLDLPEDIRVRDNGAMRYIFNYGAEATDVSALIGEETLFRGVRRLMPGPAWFHGGNRHALATG